MAQFGPILSQTDFGDVKTSTSGSGGGTFNGESGDGLEKRTSSPNAVDELTFDDTNGRRGGNEIFTPVEPPVTNVMK